MFSLESPHRGDSTENTQYTIISIKKKFTLNNPKYVAMRFFSKGLKNEFETAKANEPLVFGPLKFYCNSILICSKKSFLSTFQYKRNVKAKYRKINYAEYVMLILQGSY